MRVRTRYGIAAAVSLSLIVLALIPLPSNGLPQTTGDDPTFFESKIRPLLLDKCSTCHGATAARGGLKLDSASGLLRGGTRGAAIVRGNPDKSLLVQAIRYQGALKMPPAGPLSSAEVENVVAWVKRGALWPEPVAEKAAAGSPARTSASPGQAKSTFWSFVPVRRPAIPAVKDRQWVKSPIDAFVLSALETKGLTHAAAADRRTLIRRGTFDLTGLPPTPQEVEDFLADRSPQAWEKVVDRLLASPRYGERWARHWLDVARYADSADSRGLGGEGDISEAWRYRDWVIDAFNHDLPYNQFIINQIAGDLLPPEGRTDVRQVGHSNETLNVPGTIATSLLAIGNWGNGDADKDKILTDIADDQVDIVSRGFMGLTIGCARCHDHKFDPISTKDYYGMAGIFFSTHILPKLTPKGAGETPLRVPLETAADRDRRAQYAASLADLEKLQQSYRTEQLRAFAHSMLPQTAAYLEASWAFAHRPASQQAISLEEFAAKRGLRAFALRQWQDYLSLSNYRLMTSPFDKLAGVSGVYGFHGTGDLPSITANANAEAKTISTFTLPAHSISVHPSSKNGVVIAWKSPISGSVKVEGRVVDGDAACGNGIEWAIDRRGSRGASEIASGAFENGGSQGFAAGKGGAGLSAVTVKEGESLEVVVLPKGEYSCDTTTVELTIREAGGPHVWNLTDDVATDLLKGNPHSDHYGHADTWRFFDMAESHRGAAVTDAALSAWYDATGATETPADAGASDPARVKAAAEQFQSRFTIDDNRSPFWINRLEDEAALPQVVRARFGKLSSEIAELRRNAPPPVIYANAAQEGGCPESPHAGVHDVRVHIRGSYARLGDLVPRHFPVVLAGENQPPITHGSGRLELARWIASDTHPTTARVMVNRIWQHHFGQGIVRTPSNFGKLGERPTNQPLLDYLASEFVRGGWSIKQMHRMILLSATYQQSSIAPAKTLRIDPDNRLCGRMSRTRIEAESLRDSLLFVTGKLDTTMGGPAYRDFNTPRRTVYLMTIRSDRSGYGPLFDAADPTATMEKRTSSNVAPQALFLMNDPFALGQVKLLASRIMSAAPSDSLRIDRAYGLLYGRSPSPAELQIGLSYLNRVRQRPQEKAAGMPKESADVRAWQAYSQVLICANEFLYVD